jgi:HAD superfamily hydrolase (TIGR01509 family)
VTAALRLETVLFDVDGTLIDSNAAHAQAWGQALGEYGVAVDVAEVRRLIGIGGDKLLPAVAHVKEHSRLGRAIARRKKAIFSTLLPDLQPTPGARPLLEYLREQSVNLVIATSADAQDLSALLEQAGIDDLIPDRASKDDAPKSKPDPDIVHAALASSHATPELSVLIGDTPYDIEAAARAGIKAIALRCGGYWPDSTLRGALEIHDDPGALLAHWRVAADVTVATRS